MLFSFGPQDSGSARAAHPNEDTFRNTPVATGDENNSQKDSVEGSNTTTRSVCLRVIHSFLLLKIWLSSLLSHAEGIYAIESQLFYPCCFDLN